MKDDTEKQQKILPQSAHDIREILTDLHGLARKQLAELRENTARMERIARDIDRIRVPFQSQHEASTVLSEDGRQLSKAQLNSQSSCAANYTSPSEKKNIERRNSVDNLSSDESTMSPRKALVRNNSARESLGSLAQEPRDAASWTRKQKYPKSNKRTGPSNHRRAIHRRRMEDTLRSVARRRSKELVTPIMRSSFASSHPNETKALALSLYKQQLKQTRDESYNTVEDVKLMASKGFVLCSQCHLFFHKTKREGCDVGVQGRHVQRPSTPENYYDLSFPETETNDEGK